MKTGFSLTKALEDAILTILPIMVGIPSNGFMTDLK